MTDPRWTPPRTDLLADPRSRFFDPHDPDCAPLPPDDPAAHSYMHEMYGIRGYKHWNTYGYLHTNENPHWLSPWGLDPHVVEQNAAGTAIFPQLNKITLPQALDLAYVHSREYQLQIESVYLDALALSLERFRFDVQFVGLNNRRPSSDLLYTAGPNGDTSLGWTNRVGARQFLPTGGQFTAEFLNNTLWLFSGNNSGQTTSTLTFQLLQPLLASGGRQFALESLTQQERNLLYSLRDFALFRMDFFNGVVTSGTGATGTGFLNLLRQEQNISNQRFNILLQEEQLERLRARATEKPDKYVEPLPMLPPGLALPKGGKVRYDAETRALEATEKISEAEVEALLALSPDLAYRRAILDLAQRTSIATFTLDVAQLASNLNNARINLKNSERQLLDSLDRFKQLLGLPTDMPLTIDQSMLRPFQLIDPRLSQLQDDIKAIADDVGSIDRGNPDLTILRSMSRLLHDFVTRLKTEGIDVLDVDLRNARAALPKRLQEMATDEDRARLQDYIERDSRLITQSRHERIELEDGLRTITEQLTEPELPLPLRQQILANIFRLRESALRATQNLIVLQVGLRTELIELIPFDISQETATLLSLENRTDLMNIRALVMDARRRIEVAGTQLQSMLDVVAQVDLRTRQAGAGLNNPFDFRGGQSIFRAGINFTTPIQLISERNIYRTAQIAYQQARRNSMRFEDQVKFEVRSSWRQLKVLRENFETARQGVRIAAIQYDQAVEQANAPVTGTGGGAGGRGQGLNLIQAVNSLLQAQNNLIGIWIDHETNRLNIHRHMGIMAIDERGVWVDDFYQRMAANGSNSSQNVEFGPPPTPRLPVRPDGTKTEEPAHAPATTQPKNSGPLPFLSQGLGTGERRMPRPSTVHDEPADKLRLGDPAVPLRPRDLAGPGGDLPRGDRGSDGPRGGGSQILPVSGTVGLDEGRGP